MRPVEQHRHFAEHRARLADDGDLRIAAQHLDAAFGQNIKPPGRLAFGEENGSRSEFLTRCARAFIEDRGHRPLLSSRTT